MKHKGIRFYCTNKEQHRDVTLGVASTITGILHNREARNAPERPFWGPDGEWLGGIRPGELGKRIKDGRAVLSPYARLLRDDPGTRYEDNNDGTWTLHADGAGYALLCPKCGRNPQISGARWKAAIDGLKAAGFSEVDISSLPF